ncbi:hypothetical protein SEA_VROOMVROOM_38 [Arthrobacter phage VroomVroom]|uniref:Uncharacterized protein n=1 Tax=Arthrobacter phage VroomVroom TaxID=3049371 RepID=A0AA49IUK5_9CAUD|nr:hypothetical protein SEA_VROOMVROOM_38 [Arthrobacter phage VroomVroom]
MKRAYYALVSAFLNWPIWADVLEDWAERFHAWAVAKASRTR